MAESQSGVVRERARRAAHRITEAWNELPDFPLNLDNDATAEANLAAVEDDLTDLGTTMEFLETQLLILFECHNTWTAIIDKLEGDERATEVSLRDAFERGPCKLTEMLDKTQAKVDKYKKQKATLEKQQRKFEREIEAEEKRLAKEAAEAERLEREARGHGGPRGGGAPPPPPRSTAVRLPALEVPKFEGSVQEFQGFWELFEENIDKNPELGDRQRFGYLKSYLVGRALKTISGLKETEANYGVAKTLLKEEYGKPEVLKDVLYDELRDLKRPDNKATALRLFKSDLERICRQLENLGEDLQQRHLTKSLERKLPDAVLPDLVQKQKATTTWNTDELRKFVGELADTREAIERAQGKEPKQATQQSHGSKPKSAKGSDDSAVFTPSGAFAATVQKRSSGKAECFLCGERHLTIYCTKYADAERRRERASQARLCFKCLQSGHDWRKCPSTKVCSRCKRDNHHSALCLQDAPSDEHAHINGRRRSMRDQRRGQSHSGSSDKKVTAAAALANPEENADQQQSRINNVASASSSDRPRQPSPTWITSSSLTVGAQSVTVDRKTKVSSQNGSSLLTIDATVQNALIPERKTRATLFYDCGSQINCVTTTLAKQLGLPKLGSHQFQLNTLACEKPQKLTLDMHLLKVPLKDGSNVELVVFAMERLVGELTAVQVKPIPDPHPDGHRWFVRTNRVEPQILVGNQSYWSFRLTEIDRLRNGTRIIDSALGYMATKELDGSEIQGWPIISVCPLVPSEEEHQEESSNYVTDSIVRRILQVPVTPSSDMEQVRDSEPAYAMLVDYSAETDGVASPPMETEEEEASSDVSPQDMPCTLPDDSMEAVENDLHAEFAIDEDPASGASAQVEGLQTEDADLPYAMPSVDERHKDQFVSGTMEDGIPVIDVSKFRDLSRLKRVVVCVHRAAAKFMALIDKRTNQPWWSVLIQNAVEPTSHAEDALARQYLIKQDQRRHPPLADEVPIWNLRRNANGLYVGNVHPDMPIEIGYRLFLSRESPLRWLLLRDFHRKYKHLGIQQVLDNFHKAFLSPIRTPLGPIREGTNRFAKIRPHVHVATSVLNEFLHNEPTGEPPSKKSRIQPLPRSRVSLPLCRDDGPDDPGSSSSDDSSDEPRSPMTKISWRFTGPAFLSLLMFLLATASATPTSTVPNTTRRCLGRICPESHQLMPVRVQRCVSAGVVLYKDRTANNFCYKIQRCADGKHLNMPHAGNYTCGDPCRCNDWWSMDCSNYHGRATQTSHVGNEAVRRVLKELHPDICSFEPTANCSVPYPTRLFKVQLFDQTTHYVKNLNLLHVEDKEEDVVCVGSGIQATGTKRFCEVHRCHENATKFCFHPYPERVYLQGHSGEVLVRAWGAIHTVVYVSELVPAPPRNSSYELICKPYGFDVKAERRQVAYQVYSEGLYIDKTHPKLLEQIRLPRSYLLHKYPGTLTVWDNGQKVAEQEVECPGRDICEQIDCTFCRATLRNAQCVRASSVAGLLIASYFVGFIIFLCWNLKKRFSRRAASSMSVDEDAGTELHEMNRNPELGQRRPLLNYSGSEALQPPPRLTLPLLPPLPPRAPSVETTSARAAVPTTEQPATPNVYEDFRARADNELTQVSEEDYVYVKQEERQAESDYSNTRLLRVIERRARRARPLSFSTMTIGLIACLSFLELADACVETIDVVASTQMCYQQADGSIRCYYNQLLEILVGDTKRRVCLTLKNSQAQPMGTAVIDVSGVELVCTHVPGHFTRQFEMDVVSAKKCYSMGSCQEDACAETNTSTLIKELTYANQYPGFTYCRNGAGGWWNRCWSFTDACVFFRTIPRAVSPRIGEVFQCSWTPTLRVTVTVQVLDMEPQESSFELTAAKTVIQGNLSLTASSISLPPLPALNHQFVSDGVRAAIVTSKHQRLLECKTRADAMSIRKCVLHSNPCSCGVAGNVGVCDCIKHGSEMDSLDDPEGVLPRHVGSTWIANNRSRIYARPAFTDARIDVSFRNLRLEVKADNSSCELTPLTIRGCHGCSRGASLEYTCRTDFGAALGEVRCPSLIFTAHCDRTGSRYSQHFLTDYKVVKEVCSMRCPNGTSMFEIQGTLADTEVEISRDQHIAGLETASDFKWSDVLGYLQDVWSFILHSILLWDIKAWLITIAVVLVGSVGLVWLFRYVEKNHPNMLRFAILALIVPAVHASQRTASNPFTWTDLNQSYPGEVTTLWFPSHSDNLLQFPSVMAQHVSDQGGLELIEELADYEDMDMEVPPADGADESILDEVDEGNQVVLEAELQMPANDQRGDEAELQEERPEAEVDIRPPPAKLASVVVLPRVQPSAPPKVHSVVVSSTYKQISDDTRHGFEINGRCDREMPGHENCRHVLLKEVDHLAPTELRNLPIRTPLQHALVLLSTRGVYGEQTNQFLRRLLRSEVAAKAITVFSQFSDLRQDPQAMIKRTDLFEAMSTRYKRCSPAKEFLEKSPYLAIWYRTRCAEMAVDNKEQFRSLFGDLADVLESVRTRELFPGRARVKISAAIVGDQLADELKKSQQDGGLAITATTTASVLEALHTYVFGASCKYLVVLTGHSDLRKGCEPNEIYDDCRKIVAHLSRYPHLKVYWLPLPFIYNQRNSWNVLVEKMRGISEGVQNHIFLDTFNGRSTLEFFREGNAYAMDRIDDGGRPTIAGWRVLTRFLREAVRVPLTGTIAGPKRAKKRARRELNEAVRALDGVHIEAGPSRAESPTGSVLFVAPSAKHQRIFHDSRYD